MMRGTSAWLAALACLAVFATCATAGELFLVGFAGYDYQDANPLQGPIETDYLALTEGYRAIGFATSSNATYLGLDFVNNENTFTLGVDAATDLIVNYRDYTFPFIQVTCTDGRVRFYADPIVGGASHAIYGINPPNATAPSTFRDGNLVLGGVVTNFSLTYDVDFSQGSWVGNVCFDEGSALVNIPADQRCGWVMAGQLGRPNLTVPQGYDNQISGECLIPESTPTSVRSWGSIKQLYR
jgi:hypothetical protein